MTTLYNEIEPFPAQWLRNLQAEGIIAGGRVDERDIQDLEPENLDGTRQFHAFAGIGAWSYALRLAGVPDDIAVWTGSCPCQPFSVAGKQKGTDDKRHLWPAWFSLIRECRPPVVFGEQVASPAGRAWLDSVSADLEGVGYRVGTADLCAAGVGAPHIRQRLWFVAHAIGARLERPPDIGQREEDLPVRRGGDASRVADTDRERQDQQYVRLRQRRSKAHLPKTARGRGTGLRTREQPDEGDDAALPSPSSTRPTHGFWGPTDWLRCRDGKWRPVEPGTFPLADRSPGRVGQISAYRNAIVPQVAAAFIQASFQALGETPQ